MRLSAGQRLGTYDVLGPLGAGGMGEVYRAQDTRLGREVAIKVLSAAFAADPGRLARFEREARALAALNHPAVAGIYELGQEGTSHFLVLELVPGQTLAERLARGPLPVPDALRTAAQVAEALEAAHRAGIVHRDLKPSNVKITPEGRVKVLDFGLAKVMPLPTDITQAPTLGDDTREGVILGTPSYMSPEQARGRAVDRRTDVWAFGCVLFEMLAGRRAFDGETGSDAMAAVLGREPEWAALPKETPEPIRHLLRRCLEKDPERRLRDVGDARLAIEGALALGTPSRRPRLGPRAAAGLLAVLALAAAWVVARRPGTAPEPTLQPRLTQLTFGPGTEAFPAWSPGGDRLALTVDVGSVRKIFVKRVDTGEEKQLTTGPSDDIQPAWSPDGRTILFARGRQPGQRLEPGDVFGAYDAGDVWSVDVESGRESLLLQDAFNPAWSPDGTRIAVDARWQGSARLWVTDGQGRNPQQVTSDTSESAWHLRPRWSPDGGRLVFQHLEGTRFKVRLVDLATRVMAWVTTDTSRDIHPTWSPSGRFVYFTSDRSGGLNIWRVPVTSAGTPAGPPRQVTAGAGQDVDAAVSPGGDRLAVAVLRQNADLWRLPVAPDTARPSGPPQPVVATTREDSRGAWSPDGHTIAFNSDRAGDMNIWLHSLRDASSRPLTRGPGGDFQPSWSPDGRTIAFFSSRGGNPDIWAVDAAGGEPRPLTRGPAVDTNPFFSPDGRHIAYHSDQGGHVEVWVMEAGGGQARPLTRVGAAGHFMRWTPGGRAVVFRCQCGGAPAVMQAPLDGGDPQPMPEVSGGSHLSFSPDFASMLDVLGHKELWRSPLRSGRPEKVFQFDDPEVRIDYPVWSPDGRWVLFDRFRPEGGDIWLIDGLADPVRTGRDASR